MVLKGFPAAAHVGSRCIIIQLLLSSDLSSLFAACQVECFFCFSHFAHTTSPAMLRFATTYNTLLYLFLHHI